MKSKKLVTVCLMLVLELQLLPIKHTVRYFFVDNLLIEEISHTNNNATKNFRVLDEDNHFLTEPIHFTPQFYLLSESTLFPYQEMLPAIHAADIHTPPPNFSIV